MSLRELKGALQACCSNSKTLTAEKLEDYKCLDATNVTSSNSIKSVYKSINNPHIMLPVSYGEATATCNTLKKPKISVRDHMASFERSRKSVVEDDKNEQGRPPVDFHSKEENNSQGQIKMEKSKDNTAVGLIQRWRDLRSNPDTRLSRESQFSEDNNISAIQNDSLGIFFSVRGFSPGPRQRPPQTNRRKDEGNEEPLRKKMKIREEWSVSEAGCKVEELDDTWVAVKDTVKVNGPVKASGTIEVNFNSEDACIKQELNSGKKATDKGIVKEKENLYLTSQPRMVAIDSVEKSRRKRINLHKEIVDISAEESDMEEVHGDRVEELGIDMVKEQDLQQLLSQGAGNNGEELLVWPSSACTDGIGDEIHRSKANIEPVKVPASINARLLPHQRDGVRFLYGLYAAKRGGILADDMGLGKTIQAIVFLGAVLRKAGSPTNFLPSYRLPPPKAPENKSSLRRPDSFDNNKQFGRVVLVITPTSVLQNWEAEFAAWGSFRVGVFHGQHRDAVLGQVLAGDLEVVLTSFDTFRLFARELCEIEWHCVVVDEAHRLKNERSKLYEACTRIRTKRRYGLTGTVMQNNFSELFNVFDWAAPGCIGSRSQFKEYYDDPMKQGQRINAPAAFVAQSEKRKARLVEVLKCFMLRRTKDATIGHLLHGKIDNVVFCSMAPLQQRVYNRMLKSPDFQLLVHKDEPCSCGGRFAKGECCHRTAEEGPIWTYLHPNREQCERCPYCIVLPCLLKLQQVSNHLQLLKANPRDSLKKQMKDRAFTRLVLAEDATLLGGLDPDESFMGLSASEHCGKMLALEKLLQSWTWDGDKVLLFSFSVRMLDILDRFLVRRGYYFSRLDGSTPMSSRQSTVDEFNRSPSKQVFLISTKAGGLGLNLVAANRVVIFDPNWNPAYDLQAQDRSFRFGQRRHVTVYRLLSAGSVEELVYTRQVYKQQLANMAISGAQEKRYFEGVQGSKEHQGELFGIGNLFKDQSDGLFTSKIIEGHEERMLRISQDLASHLRDKTLLRKQTIPMRLSEAREGEDEKVPVDEDVDVRGLNEVAKELEDEGRGRMKGREPASGLAEKERTDSEGKVAGCSEGLNNKEISGRKNDGRASLGVPEAEQKEPLSNVLQNAGIVYSHRNELVVNMQGNLKEAPEFNTEAQSGYRSKVIICGQERRQIQEPKGPSQRGLLKKPVVNRTRKHLREATATEKGKFTMSGIVKPPSIASTSVGDRGKSEKRADFERMATWKGMDVQNFSAWVKSISSEQRKQLLAEYQRSTQ